MAREDFAYVNINKPLIEAVDHAVKTVRRRGSLVYRDRRDFTEKALHFLLDKENIKEVPAQ